MIRSANYAQNRGAAKNLLRKVSRTLPAQVLHIKKYLVEVPLRIILSDIIRNEVVSTGISSFANKLLSLFLGSVLR